VTETWDALISTNSADTSPQGSIVPRERSSRPIDSGVTIGGVHEIGWPIRQATDHGPDEAVYPSDPDGDDLELMWNRPPDQWPRDGQGHGAVVGGDLDLDGLLADAPQL